MPCRESLSSFLIEDGEPLAKLAMVSLSPSYSTMEQNIERKEKDNQVSCTYVRCFYIEVVAKFGSNFQPACRVVIMHLPRAYNYYCIVYIYYRHSHKLYIYFFRQRENPTFYRKHIKVLTRKRKDTGKVSLQYPTKFRN